MNNRRILSVLHLTLILLAANARAQGPLMPPGAPGPSMKTLGEIYDNIDAAKDPRIPLNEEAPGVTMNGDGGFVIEQSGSYYLENNLNVASGSGVQIRAQGVTLDLNGFSITSSREFALGAAVNIEANSVTVRNGTIVSGVTYDSSATGDRYRGSGFRSGVYAGFSLRNIKISEIGVQGCDVYGIYCADLSSTLVHSCTVRTAGAVGIQAGVVRDCNASECGSTAIRATVVENSVGLSNGGDGINTKNALNCYGKTSGSFPGDDGIDAAGMVQNCYGECTSSSGGHGIRAKNVSNSMGDTLSRNSDSDGISAEKSVQGSFGQSRGGNGIQARMVSHSMGESHSTSGDGIQAILVSFSDGFSSGSDDGADGISANRVVGSLASVGGERIIHKYLMP